MRIAFVGAQCVGKTTLIKALLTMYPNYKFYDEVVRKLSKASKLPINEHAEDYDATQTIITNAHLTNAAESAYIHSNAFFDRCIVDSDSYGKYLYQKDKMSPRAFRYAEMVLLLIFNYFPYEAVIYIPPRLELVEDGVRDTNYDFQSAVDTVIAQNIEVLSHQYDKVTKFYILESQELTERVTEIKNLITQ